MHKLREEHDALNEKEKDKRHLVELAAGKRRKTFRDKRLALARDTQKARTDACDATAAQQVWQETRPDKARQDQTRQD